MLISRIEATDFCCFPNLDVQLAGQGLVFVIGDHRDSTSANSNGAGKSTLFKAVSWALYGQTVDGTKGDDVIRVGAKSAHATLTIVDDKVTWYVMRSRFKGKPRISLDREEAGARVPVKENKDDIEARIERIVGLDFHAFKNTVLYGQGDVTRFADPRTPSSVRHEMLHRLLRTDEFASCYEVAKKRRKVLVDERALLDRELALLERDAIALDIEGLERRVGDWEAKRCARVKQLEKQAREEARLAREVIGTTVDIAELENTLKELVAEQDRCWSEADDEDNASEGLKALEARARALEDARRETVIEGKALREQRDKLNASQCPTCTAPLGSGAPAAHIKELDDRLTQLRALAKDQGVQIEAANAEGQPLKSRIKSAREAAGKARALNASIKSVRAELERARQSSEQAERHIARAKELAREARSASDTENPHSEPLAAARAKLVTLTEQQDKTRLVRDELEPRLAQLNFWVHGYSPQGLPSFVLDDHMPFLTERANEYLDILSDGELRVNVSTQRELKSKSGEHADEITITWSVEGNDQVKKSSGQQTKVNLACDLALMDLAATREGVELDLLMIDEALDGLDKEGTARVLRLLQTLRSRRGSIFVVSHNEDVSELFERGLAVVREDGVSRIEMVR